MRAGPRIRERTAGPRFDSAGRRGYNFYDFP